MISNLALSDSIKHLKLTPLVASRLHYYGITTIEDLLQLSHHVPRTNIPDPALREIHALIDKVRKILLDGDSHKFDGVPESSDQALVGESWPQASEGAVVTDEDIPSHSCQGVTEAESSQREPGLGESSQPVLNSLDFGSVAARKPLLLSDPVEALHPLSWVIRILKQHSVDTVEALLRLPLSEFSTDPGSGTKTIEALIKKARHALSVANEGRADSPTPGLGFESPSDSIDRVPEDSADFQCESGVEVKKTLGIETLSERERDIVSVGNNNDEAPVNVNSWTGLGAEVCPPNQPNELVSMSDRSSEESVEEIAVDSRCPTNESVAILDQPWDEVLVLPGFVANGLHRAGLKTLREVIISSQGSELLTVRGFGNHAMRSLRWAIRRLKPELVSLCLGQPSSPNPSPIIHEYAINHVSTSVKRFLTHEDSIEHLKLSSLEIRILANLGVKTVRDLLCIEPSTLETCHGIGVKKIQVIKTLIENVREAIKVDTDDEETIDNNIEDFSESEPNSFSSYEPSEEMMAMLDRPWDESLRLSVRTVNGLRKAKINTLREVISASQGNELLKLSNFGNESLNDLRRALEKLEVRLRPLQPTSKSMVTLHQKLEQLGVAEQPCSVLGEEFSAKLRLIEKQHGPQTLGSLAELLALLPQIHGVGRPTWTKIAQALEAIASLDLACLGKSSQESIMTLRQKLDQLGIAEQPCSVLGGEFSAKLRLIEKQHGPQTLGSLAVLLVLRPESQGVGRQTWTKIGEALETIADLGLERYLYGENAPSNMSALVDCALETVSDADREILTYRLIDGLTLEEIAQRRRPSVSRERIRQKVKSLLDILQKKFGNIARYLITQLVSEMAEAGGLLHYETVHALTGMTSLSRVQFGLLMAGEDTYRVWHEEFLTILAHDELDRRLDALRDAIRAHGKIDISIADVQILAEQTTDFRLDVISLSLLLKKAYGLSVLPDGRIVVGQLMTVSDRLAAVLQAAGRPMHLKEIADVYQLQDSGDVFSDLVGEDAEPTDATDPLGQRSLIEHSVEGVLSRHKEVLRCGRGTFIHVTALPFSQERLNEIVEWCVRRIEGEPGAISTQFLLRELKAAGLEQAYLNPFLLKAALSRHPDIIVLRKYLVGHTGSFQENGLTLRDRVETVLLNAERPLSLTDVLQRLPEGIEYFHVSVLQCLSKADFALNIGNGRFCHVASLGYSASEREQVVDQAVCLLPEDGTPVSLESMLNRLIIKAPEISFLKEDQGRYLLWSILRKDERVECGRGYFLALKSGEKSVSLIEGMITDILKDMVVAFPRDVRRELANRYGYIRADQTVYAFLANCVEKGLARRLPQALYCLPSTDDAVLMHALKPHDYTIRKTLDDSGLADYSLDDLSLLARYFDRQDLFTEALRILDILFTRGDLPEEQRRSFKRLWTVIRQKQEGA